MTIIGIIIAFIIGLIFTLWLASRQSGYKPMFAAQPQRQSLRQSKLLAVWGIVGGMVVIGAGLIGYVGYALWFETDPTATIPQNETPNSQTQARLLIPSLGVNQKIVTVSIVKNEWDIARLGENIGWLETTGDNPNSNLAMAFIGHVTVSRIQQGPFANLWTIKPLGEIIYRKGGVDFVYVVQNMMPAKPNEVGKLFQKSKEHLLLVTCTDYNFITEKYDGRLIVDAVLVQRKITSAQTSN